jgi:hypothetical protein
MPFDQEIAKLRIEHDGRSDESIRLRSPVSPGQNRQPSRELLLSAQFRGNALVARGKWPAGLASNRGDSWEFTNAPGGISNGITSGFRDEEDIDFNLTYKQTGADNDWRWQEQWLPHAAWYLLAVSSANGSSKR